MIDLSTQRQRIANHIETDCGDTYHIGTARLIWCDSIQEFMLTLENGHEEYQSNGCGSLIEQISDTDVAEFYQEELEEVQP